MSTTVANSQTEAPAERAVGTPAAPKKARFRAARDNAVFGDHTPHENPAAIRAYRTALWGIIPFTGVVLGLVAVGLGVRAYLFTKKAGVRGINLSIAAMIMGAIEFLTTAGGLYCIGRGAGWLA